MSSLTETIQQLQGTQAAIRRLEEAASEYPDVPSLAANLRSLQKRQRDLEGRFAQETNKDFLDVCTYKVFAEQEGARVTLPALASTLGDFQRLFTVIYDAVKNGARQRARVAAETVAATAFGFNYSFTGSVGFVFTLPNERLVTEETELDKAMETMFKMAEAENPEDVLEFARTVGAAPVRLMYRWATDLVESGLGADINWRREGQVRSRLFIEVPQLEVLQQAISQTSEETEEFIEVTGQLVSADVQRYRFRMVFEQGGEIRGQMSESIGMDHTVELPTRYTAQIRKTTKISYSTEEEDTDYFLLSLYQ